LHKWQIVFAPEVLFVTCVAMKFVDDDDDDDDVSMDRCFCSQPQTMNYSVESCPLTNDPLLQLHSADDNMFTWPRDVVIKALTVSVNCIIY